MVRMTRPNAHIVATARSLALSHSLTSKYVFAFSFTALCLCHCVPHWTRGRTVCTYVHFMSERERERERERVVCLAVIVPENGREE